MKIGIIGLHSHQMNDLRARRLKHELEFLNDTTYDKQTVEAFCRKKDKVIVIVHASKARPFVPEGIRHMHSGGVSTIIRLIDTWQQELDRLNPPQAPFKPTVKVEATVKSVEEVKTPPTAEPVVEDTELGAAEIEAADGRARLVKAAKPLEEDDVGPLPAPIRTTMAAEVAPATGAFRPMPSSDGTKIKPVDVVYDPKRQPLHVVPATPSGHQDYRAVGSFWIGDCIRSHRPQTKLFGHPQPYGPVVLDFKTWLARLKKACAYYYKTRGVVIELHIWAGYADLLCLDPQQIPNHRLEDLSINDGKQLRTYKARTPKVPKEKVVRVKQQTTGVNNALTRPLTPAEDFWRQSYAAAIGRGVSPVEAAQIADQSVPLYNQRFT